MMSARIALLFLVLHTLTPSLPAEEPEGLEAATKVAIKFTEAAYTGEAMAAAKLMRTSDIERFHDDVVDLGREDAELCEELIASMLDAVSESAEEAGSEGEVLALLEPLGLDAGDFAELMNAESPLAMIESLTPAQLYALNLWEWSAWEPEERKIRSLEAKRLSATKEKTEEGFVLHILFRFKMKADSPISDRIDLVTVQNVGGEWRVVPNGWSRDYVAEFRASMEEDF